MIYFDCEICVHLQNASQLWHTDRPYVNACIQHTVLSSAPAVVAVVLAPMLVSSLSRSARAARQLVWSTLVVAKLSVTIVLMVLSILQCFIPLYVDGAWLRQARIRPYRSLSASVASVWYVYPVVDTATLLLLLCAQLLCIRHGLASTASVHVPFMMLAVCTCVEVYTVFMVRACARAHTYVPRSCRCRIHRPYIAQASPSAEHCLRVRKLYCCVLRIPPQM
jgi:hypothetical protein